MRGRYPRGIDVAKATVSTKLETVVIPPPPINYSENVDHYAKYDRKDPSNPWNRYLEYKRNPNKFGYQRHLGFSEKKFHPGKILAARKKENFLKKISERQQVLNEWKEEKESFNGNDKSKEQEKAKEEQPKLLKDGLSKSQPLPPVKRTLS
jgi:hypothetical protein